MNARLRTSSDDQCVRVKLPSRLKQSLLDGADNDPNRRLRSNSSLQIGNALTRPLPFLRLNLFLEVQLNGYIGIGDLDGMNDVEIRVRFLRHLMSIAKHSF